MNLVVIFIEAVVFALFFTVAVFIKLLVGNKEKPSNICKYPPNIQAQYFKANTQASAIKKPKLIVLKAIIKMFFTLVLLFAFAYLADAVTFLQGFGVGLGLMIWIGVFDTLFIDWVLFAKVKRFRLPGTENMDDAYGQKGFHIKKMVFPGIVFAIIPSVLTGVIIHAIQ